MNSIFHQYNAVTEGILNLLEGTQLGTNGAKYVHLDTRKHIQLIDEPLFLTIEKRNTVIANVTFCKRGKDWYMRYFAFHEAFQRKSHSNIKKSNSLFKTEFENFLKTKLKSDEVDRFYAYIDPKNDRSKTMAEQFEFQKISEVITQTFSRRRPTKSNRLTKELSFDELNEIIDKKFKHLPYFFDAHLKQGKIYGLKSDKGEFLAFAQVRNTKWRIEQLPGKHGHLLTKLVPYIPIVRAYIKPHSHKFLTLDTVWVKDNNPKFTKELFEAILHSTQHRLLIWWVSPNNDLYKKTLARLKWGVFDKLIGRNKVDVMCKSLREREQVEEIYSSSLDFI